MAKGKKCPECEHYMYAKSEKDYPAGTEVVYVCRSCGFEERVFEDKNPFLPRR
jgi:DNA-directed RNA polymerase subunit M/transcription elongation factor TFIIS